MCYSDLLLNSKHPREIKDATALLIQVLSWFWALRITWREFLNVMKQLKQWTDPINKDYLCSNGHSSVPLKKTKKEKKTTMCFFCPQMENSLWCGLSFGLQTFFGISWPLSSFGVLAHWLQQHPTEGLHHRVRLAHLDLQIMSIAAVGCRQT